MLGQSVYGVWPTVSVPIAVPSRSTERIMTPMNCSGAELGILMFKLEGRGWQHVKTSQGASFDHFHIVCFLPIPLAAFLLRNCTLAPHLAV